MISRRHLLAGVSLAALGSKAHARMLRGGVGTGSASATLIATRTGTNYDSGSTPASFYATIGQGFKQGNVPSGSYVEMRLNDGTTVIAQQQADNRTYFADGSLKFANFQWKHPNLITASGSETVKFYAKVGSFSNSTSITTAPILAKDYRVEVVISGTTYYCLLNNEVNANARVVECRAGAAVRAWRIWGELRNGTTIGSAAQGDLWALFYVYVYSDSTIRILAQLNSSRSANTTSNAYTATSIKFKDGATTKVDLGAQTIYGVQIIPFLDGDAEEFYNGTTIKKVVWRFPLTVLADPTTTGMYDSCCMWWYKSSATEISNISANLSASGDTWSCYYCAADYFDLDATGAHVSYGPLPQSSIQAYLLGDYVSLRNDKMHAVSMWPNAPYWYVDYSNGAYPPSLDAISYTGMGTISTLSRYYGSGATYTIVGGAPPPQTGVAQVVTDATHAPLYCYYQYLFGGQEWWLDAMHQQVNGCMGCLPVSASVGTGASRNETLNSVVYKCTNWGVYGQMRQNAGWSRWISDTNWVTPDNHPVKPYVLAMATTDVSSASDAQIQQSVGNFGSSAANVLGILDYGENQNPGLANDGWMHDFLMFAFAMNLRRGSLTTAAEIVVQHLRKWVIGRGVDACLATAPDYNRGIRQGANPTLGSPFCTAWSQVYEGDIDGGTLNVAVLNPFGGGCPASPTVVDGGGIGYLASDTNYPNIYQASMVCAQIAGISGASSAVTYYAAVETASGVTEADWGTQGGVHMRIRIPA